MKIEELYPTDEEIWQVYVEEANKYLGGEHEGGNLINRQRLAKFAVDNAVKKIVEGIGKVIDEAPYNKKILSVIGYLSELEEASQNKP